MRTTIDLPDDLLAELKRLAAATHRTLRSVIVDALRQALSKRADGALEPLELTTYGSGGLQPGIDLDDTAALLDRMDEA